VDKDRFCELLLGLARQYQKDKQPKPELVLLVEAFQAGGSLDLPDLSAWSNSNGYDVPCVRRRLRVAARAGIHWEAGRIYAAPSTGEVVHNLSAGFPHPPARAAADASAGAAADAAAGGSAAAHNAAAGGSSVLFQIYSSSSCLDSRHAQSRAYALVRPSAGKEGEYLEHGRWLVEAADLPITSDRLHDAAVAIYSAEINYGSLEGVKEACRRWLAIGKSGGFEGTRYWVRKNGFVEYMTRPQFAKIALECNPFAAFAESAKGSIELELQSMDELVQEEQQKVSNDHILQSLKDFWSERGTT
jgi:hypothetical protein